MPFCGVMTSRAVGGTLKASGCVGMRVPRRHQPRAPSLRLLLCARHMLWAVSAFTVRGQKQWLPHSRQWVTRA